MVGQLTNLMVGQNATQAHPWLCLRTRAAIKHTGFFVFFVFFAAAGVFLKT